MDLPMDQVLLKIHEDYGGICGIMEMDKPFCVSLPPLSPTLTFSSLSLSLSLYIYIYIYIYVCVCVCVCEGSRKNIIQIGEYIMMWSRR